MRYFFKSFFYACKGILTGLRLERNLKIQIIIGAITVGGGFYFDISLPEWCLIILCIGLVLGTELMNTAVENLVNLVTKEQNPLAGKIKDMAAGAVLIISLTSLIVGIVIFRKYLS